MTSTLQDSPNLFKIIDLELHKFYKQQNKGNEYMIDGKGKFLLFIEENEFDHDGINDEIGDNADYEDCGYLDFDENFPISISKNNKYNDNNNNNYNNIKRKEIFKILQKIYKDIRLNMNHPPTKNKNDKLKKLCNGLAMYYESMGKINYYYDENENGLFSKWFKDQQMEIDEIDEELQDGNQYNCGYLEFDDIYFPFIPPINDENEKQLKIFKIMQHCLKYGSFKEDDSYFVRINRDNENIKNYFNKNKMILSLDCFILMLHYLPILDILKIIYEDNWICLTEYDDSFGDDRHYIRKSGKFQFWNICLYSTEYTDDFMRYWKSIDLTNIFSFIYMSQLSNIMTSRRFAKKEKEIKEKEKEMNFNSQINEELLEKERETLLSTIPVEGYDWIDDIKDNLYIHNKIENVDIDLYVKQLKDLKDSIKNSDNSYQALLTFFEYKNNFDDLNEIDSFGNPKNNGNDILLELKKTIKWLTYNNNHDKLYDYINKWYAAKYLCRSWSQVTPFHWILFGLMENSINFVKITDNKEEKIMIHLPVLFWDMSTYS